MAARYLYTRYSRSHDKAGLHGASNASAPAYNENTLPGSDDEAAIEKNGFPSDVKVISASEEDDSTTSLSSDTPAAARPIAIFRQYLTTATTTLTVRENSLPSLPDSFTVANGTTPIFNIHRERPSLRRQQIVTDARTSAPVMTVRHNVGTLPASYTFVDPSDNRILDLQGNFFIPNTGSRSTAFLLNSETGQKIELALQGSYRNHKGMITNKETGEVLVTMKSNIFELRNVVGGRRTYTVTIRAGIDMAVVTGLIVALDARAQ